MPFEIPDSWEWTTLPDLCTIPITDGTHQTPTYAEKQDGIPFLSSKDVTSGKINWSDIKYITKELHQELYKRVAPHRNDILLAKNGTTGIAALVDTDIVFDIYVTLALIRPVKYILPKYLLYVINSHFCKEQFNEHLTGIGLPNLHLRDINKTFIPLPPTEEQQRIVTMLDNWFEQIEDIDSNRENLLRFILQAKSKILDLAIHGKLVPQDPNDEPAIDLLKRINPSFVPCDTSHYENLPEGWTVCRIQDAFDICMGSSPTGDSLNRQNKGVEFHQGKICFSDIYLQPSEVYTTKPTKLAENHTILLCVRAPVGMVNITKKVICIGRGLCALKPRQGVDLMFAFYAMQTHENNFDKQATGSTFKAISGSTIREEEFVLPPYNEQVRIRHAIETIFVQLDTITAEL